MKFGFSEEQRLFQQAVRALLEKDCTPQAVRAGPSGDTRRIPGLWRKLADAGVAGITTPAAQGGLGLGAIDLVLILEECGRAVLPEPVVETLAVAAPMLAASGEDPWLPLIATGNATAAVALADHPYATFADSASVVLVEDAGHVVAVPRASVSLTRQESLDPTHPAFTVSAREPGHRLAGGAVEVLDRAAFGYAAVLLGIAARVIEMAAEYARARTQFGRPIGEYQAVKHLLADALVRTEFARPVVYRAAVSVDVAAPHRSRDASHAKAAASEAATHACRAALQVHGAIGYTEEHDLHLWLRRAWTLASAWGDAAWHRGRLAKVVLQ